jgi:hypothetical protein
MGLLRITESERREILNLHNNAKIIKEQGTSLVAPTGTAAPAAPAAPAAAPSVETVVKELQTLLNTKYGAKLTVDGKWGNLTQTAFENAVKSKGTQLPTVTVTGQKAPDPAIAAAPVVPLPSVATPAAPGVSGQPAAPAAAPATPAAPAAPTTPAAPAIDPTNTEFTDGGDAAPQSNRDQRRARQDLRRGNRRAMQDLRANQRAQQ